MPRRFPAPWSYELASSGESWVVKDASGFSITWFHFREQEIVGTSSPRMTKEEARKMAANFARLPELLKR